MKVNNQYNSVPQTLAQAVDDGFFYDYHDGELECLRRDVNWLKELVARLIQSVAKDDIDEFRFLVDQSYWDEVK